MSTFYLINTVTVASTKVFAGDLINDAVDDVVGIRAVGGLLWPSSNSTIATAALKATNARINKGASETEINEIMQSAVDAVQLITDEGVATLALLTASDDSVADTVRKVAAVMRSYQLDKASSQAIDGINSLATASGVGRWLTVPIPVPHWANQLNWDLDSAAGNDENSGIAGAGAPIKTMMEINRRLRMVNSGSTYTVNVFAAGIPSNDTIRWNPQLAGNPTGGTTTLLLKGVTTNTVSSAFTATSASVPSTNTQASVTDNSVTWSAQIGQLITMTSGAASGAQAMIAKDLGAGAARVSDFYFPASGVASAMPAPADTYVIKALPVLLGGFGGQAQQSRCKLSVQDLTYSVAAGMSMAGDMTFTGVRFTVPLSVQGTQYGFFGLFCCSVHLSVLGTALSSTGPQVVQFFGGGFINCRLDVAIMASYAFRSLFQASVMRHTPTFSGGGFVSIGASCGFFDSPGGTSAITIGRNMYVDVRVGAELYGSGNALFGVVCNEGSTLIVDSSITPTLTGTSGDFSFDGMTTALPALEADAQFGTSTLALGVSPDITANLTATSRILVTPKDKGASVTIGRLEVPAADRVNGAAGTFKVRSFTPAATAETADVSTFDWMVRPSLSPLTTWAQYVAAPFSRNVASHKSLARIIAAA